MRHAPALARLGRIASAATESRALRAAALDELGRSVPFDACVWLLTDPETSVGVAPLASVPPALMPELPRLIRLKYLTPVNRWTTLSRAARLDTPAASLVWRELLHAHGVTDVASVVFRDRYGCWAFLDLWRLGGTFADDELAFLDDVAALLTPHLRRCVAGCFETEGTGGTLEPGPVMLLLDAGLRVVGQTPRTVDYLARLLPDTDTEPVPAAAYNVAAQLVAVENGVDEQPPLARTHLAGGRWLTLRAARLGPTFDQIAVTLEDSSLPDRSTMFARACGLAARESELLRHLTTGADTRTIAARMFLSENTVQDHLKSIFDKTGTRSRRALLSRAAGTG
ncbi:helix-turn-helix transcriptional regulator [Asanoa ishikariensis]|uniref:Regulatory protein, luxR family n=1 Tax=Asanoa ishikariensis TaxID=137265 RepID=A0A1H3NQH9_9ACTN|nr:helix-turn-helix transcriptional regulator [Asanoa ishikariensis]GIF68439.1 helix-turn-helix transcriptional regulator [Asanoa ishikariensis]SDY91161.1 regulatory protein, luxR family [Asanoa ishikariensis]